MPISLRLEKLKARVTKEHMDVFKYVEHAIAAIDNAIEEHDKTIAQSAIAGEKIDGKLENAFHQAMTQARDIILTNFEKTVDDFEKMYVKGTEKNFKDGVQ